MDLSFAYLRERDIDILLVEELSVNPEFGAWFCAELHEGFSGAKIASVMQSLNTKYDGETDIQVVAETAIGRLGILLENKISARPQPNQAKNYQKRGEAGIHASQWAKFITCLVAPRKYIEGPNEAPLYDACISYEMLLEYFSRSTDSRSTFKGAMLREAIEQNRRGQVAETNEQVTTLLTAYSKLANSEFLHLGEKARDARKAGAHWMVFQPKDYPKGVMIRHKLPQGEVRLYLPARGWVGIRFHRAANPNCARTRAQAGRSLSPFRIEAGRTQGANRMSNGGRWHSLPNATQRGPSRACATGRNNLTSK